MPVEPREGETFDQLLRRFKTSMDKAGILREYKRKQRFRTNAELVLDFPSRADGRPGGDFVLGWRTREVAGTPSARDT